MVLPAPRPLRVRGFAFGALCLGLALASLAGELLIRATVPDPSFVFENRIGLFAEDAAVGYRNRPLFSGWAQGRIRVETNSLGLRGPEVSTVKPDGAVRLLGLGDSVTWGVSVQEPDVYLRRLETRLNAGHRATATGRVETLNAGVIGYSTQLELLFLQHHGLALCPDIVLVAFTLNDSYPTEDPFGNVARFHSPVRTDVGRRLYDPLPPPASYLYRYVRSMARIWSLRLRASNGPDPRAREWLPRTFADRTYPVIEEHFRAFRRTADSGGFRPLVLLMPTAVQAAGAAPPVPQERLRRFFDKEGIPAIDLLDTLRGRPDAFVDYMHLSPAGHRLVADAIAADVTRRGWLEGPARATPCTPVPGATTELPLRDTAAGGNDQAATAQRSRPARLAS